MLGSLQLFVALAYATIFAWSGLLTLRRDGRSPAAHRTMLVHTTLILCLITPVLFLGAIGLDARSAQAHDTYERRMKVLAPVFSGDERNRLIAARGNVKTPLMAQMDELANRYMARGTFAVSFFLATLAVLDMEGVRLEAH
jgi:hypothetical protein